MKDGRVSALSIRNIEAKVLTMIEFDDILNSMFSSPKNWESSAQLNYLNDIMGTLYNYLKVS